jgi:hypothetical protein
MTCFFFLSIPKERGELCKRSRLGKVILEWSVRFFNGVMLPAVEQPNHRVPSLISILTHPLEQDNLKTYLIVFSS